jgi:hypothetical protein
LIYGTLLFAVMRFAPEGLSGMARGLLKRVDFHPIRGRLDKP